MKILKKEDINSGNIKEKSLSIHYPEFYEYLCYTYPNISYKERLFWYYNDLKETPVCKTCGKMLKYKNFREGYGEYCNTTCSNSNKKKQEKTKNTNIKRYGGIAPSCNEDIKNKIQQTSIEKYGVKNAMQCEKIKNKSKQTNIEKYGGCGNASVILHEKQQLTMLSTHGDIHYNNTKKRKDTCIKKYGVDSPSKLESVRNKISLSRKKRTILDHNDVINWINDNSWLCKCPYENCNKCEEKTYVIPCGCYRDRLKNGTIRCTKLLPISLNNNKNTSIEIFVRQLLDEYNIKYITNTKDIISPYELDIYIPDKKVAIECNGVYSHSSKYKNNTYHHNKWQMCKNNGIQLITLWEDWIKNKPEIVKSLLLAKLQLISHKIYARQCVVKEISNSVCNAFLEENHIQGKSGSGICLGLYKESELVSVMTFTKKRLGMGSNSRVDGEWELSRFCVKKGLSIVGGASKLFNYFIKDQKNYVAYIYSFSSNDISDGNLYKKLGFSESNHIDSCYWYVDPKTMNRYHRMTFCKDAIVRLGWKENKEGWTEEEVMLEKGYLRIYDSGMIKWVYYNKYESTPSENNKMD